MRGPEAKKSHGIIPRVSLDLHQERTGVATSIEDRIAEIPVELHASASAAELIRYAFLSVRNFASQTKQAACALFSKTPGGYTPQQLNDSNAATYRLFGVLRVLVFFASLLVLASGALGQEAAPAAPNSGPVIRFVKNPDQAPDFKIDDLDGKPLSLSASVGKVILLNFWATWCGPCRAEIPDLIELQKKYGDRLQIIGLDVDDDDSAEVKKFVEKNSINYPVGMATNEIRIQYGGVAALPTSFVIDSEGRVVQKHEGLRNPLLYEYEIRSLIGLAIPARVETFEDTGEVFLKHADRANTLPGVDMSKLTAEQKQVALHRFNAEGCTCGCQFTLAQCRIYDRGCPISKERTTKIIAEVSGHAAPSPAHKAESPKAAPAADAPNPNPTQHANIP
jgi:thiol-disulfide isomerase/thioredoxin